MTAFNLFTFFRTDLIQSEAINCYFAGQSIVTNSLMK